MPPSHVLHEARRGLPEREPPHDPRRDPGGRKLKHDQSLIGQYEPHEDLGDRRLSHLQQEIPLTDRLLGPSEDRLWGRRGNRHLGPVTSEVSLLLPWAGGSAKEWQLVLPPHPPSAVVPMARQPPPVRETLDHRLPFGATPIRPLAFGRSWSIRGTHRTNPPAQDDSRVPAATARKVAATAARAARWVRRAAPRARLGSLLPRPDDYRSPSQGRTSASAPTALRAHLAASPSVVEST